MLAKVLRKEKVGGTRLLPGLMQDVPDWAVDDLLARGVIEQPKPEGEPELELIGADGLRDRAMPTGSRVVAKMPAAVVRIWPVIATRNRAEWLQRQLASLMPQLKEGERVVVVVDGDADVLGDDSEQVVYVRLERQHGADMAKRIGIAVVPSDAVVCEIDDHDIASDDLLVRLRDRFGKPETLAAYCDVWEADPGRKIRKLRRKEGGVLRERGLGWGMRAFRKWVYDCVGAYPLDWFPAADFVLMSRIEEFGGPEAVAHIAEPLVTVTCDVMGLTGQNKELQQRQVERAFAEVAHGGWQLPFRLARGPRADKPEPAAGVAGTFGPQAGATVIRRTVPKILHFVWVGSEMPGWAKYNIARFKALNPGYIVLVHGAEILLEKLRPGYEAITGEHADACRADLLRVSALAKLSGWYFDADFLPLRPVDDIYEAHGNFPKGFYLTQGTPNLVANGVIATAANSEFLRILVAELERLASAPGPRGWDSYGPKLYTRLARAHPDKVDIGGMAMFYPYARRADAWDRYRELVEADCSPQIVRKVFEGNPPPFALHMSMQGQVDMEADDPDVVA